MSERCECGHEERDHRSIPPYHCQHGMGGGAADCECPHFMEQDRERLAAENEHQRYEDQQERYR